LTAISYQIQSQTRALITSQEAFSTEFDHLSEDPDVSDDTLLRLVANYENERRVKKDRLLNFQDLLHASAPKDLGFLACAGSPDVIRAMSTELEAQFADGTATFEGDIVILGVLASTLVDFASLLEVLPGTRDEPAIEPHSEAFQANTGQTAIANRAVNTKWQSASDPDPKLGQPLTPNFSITNGTGDR